jgi:hypothetical protein
MPAELARLCGGADLVLSDMAPKTTGARLKDHVDQLELVREAWRIAQRSSCRRQFLRRSSMAEARRALDDLRRSFDRSTRPTRSNAKGQPRDLRRRVRISRLIRGVVIHSTSVRTITPFAPPAR